MTNGVNPFKEDIEKPKFNSSVALVGDKVTDLRIKPKVDVFVKERATHKNMINSGAIYSKRGEMGKYLFTKDTVRDGHVGITTGYQKYKDKSDSINLKRVKKA